MRRSTGTGQNCQTMVWASLTHIFSGLFFTLVFLLILCPPSIVGASSHLIFQQGINNQRNQLFKLFGVLWSLLGAKNTQQGVNACSHEISGNKWEFYQQKLSSEFFAVPQDSSVKSLVLKMVQSCKITMLLHQYQNTFLDNWILIIFLSTFPDFHLPHLWARYYAWMGMHVSCLYK